MFKLFKIIFSAAVIGSYFVVCQPALAVGVVVKPSRLEISGRMLSPSAKEILVINNTAEPAIYKVYPDSYRSQISAAPAEFQLAGNESRIVNISAKFNWPGERRLNISVVGRPLGASELAAASGVKIPVTLTVAGWGQFWLFLVLISLCLVLGFAVKSLRGRTFKQ
jgi:hypothetical protein